MGSEAVLYGFGLQVAIAVCLWIVIDLYGKHGPRSRRVPIMLTACLAGAWATGELITLGAETATQRAVGRVVLFSGSLFIAPAWLWTAASIDRPAWFVRRPWLIAVAAIPLALGYAAIFVQSPVLFVDLTSKAPSHGPLFPFVTVPAFLTFALGAFYSVRSTQRLTGRFDWRAACVLLAVAVPSLASIAYLSIDAITVDMTPILVGGAAAALRFTLLEAGYTGALPLGQESVIDQLDTGVVLADLEDNIVDANPAARAMLGDTLLSRPLDDVLRMAREDTESVIGTERVVLRRRGMVVGYAAVFTDRTHAAKLERQLADRQKLESLGVLAGGIAHDFNNLLAGILGNARTARNALQANDAALESIDEVLHGARLATHLSGQLLSYTGKRRYRKQPVDLGALLGEITPLLKRALGHDRRLDIDVAPRPLPVVVDTVEIQQVLLNLVTNAGEATRPGGRVKIRLYEPTATDTALPELVAGHRFTGAPCMALEVSDDGSGMNDAVVERIFDPFFSTKDRGHGLGLAATLGIVHGHEGAMAVRSAPGMGTVFRVFLPAAEHARSETSTPEPASRGAGRILIVDDEPYLLRAVEKALGQMGFATLSATRGEEAIEIFRARGHEIDVVLLDYKMPGLSGLATFRKLREIDPGVTALLTSGHYKDDSGSPEELGFAGFLQKPYDLRDLGNTLRRFTAPGRRAPRGRSDASERSPR